MHFFPSSSHEAVAMQLSLNLNGIVAQRLLPLKDGAGRVVAAEVMLSTPRIRELLRKIDLAGIRSVMQSPAGIQEGMQTFDYAVFQLIKADLIDAEAGMNAADSPNDLKMRLKGLL
jgi:twitching motility protein PilU